MHPFEYSEKTSPGTAYTSLLNSKAKSAVIRLPPLFLLSTTIVPFESPAIILFLWGKFDLKGLTPASYSLKIKPFSSISLYRLKLDAG